MKNSGFTLLETVLYLALFSLLISGALVAVYALLGSASSSRSFEAAYSEGLFVQQKLSFEMARVSSVVVVDSRTLKIIQPDSVVWFTASSSQVWLRHNDGDTEPLSSPEFIVSDVQLQTVPAISGTQTYVQVIFILDDIPFLYETYVPKR